ncbi:hypothetical protein AYJ56_02755 [Brucella anthropi]|nr:hypothetical protein AYJ56_02755 [Brucella anthropi]
MDLWKARLKLGSEHVSNAALTVSKDKGGCSVHFPSPFETPFSTAPQDEGRRSHIKPSEHENAARLGGVFSLDLMNWIAC